MKTEQAHHKAEDLEVVHFYTQDVWALLKLDPSFHVFSLSIVFMCKSKEELELRLAAMGLRLGKQCCKNEVDETWEAMLQE